MQTEVGGVATEIFRCFWAPWVECIRVLDSQVLAKHRDRMNLCWAFHNSKMGLKQLGGRAMTQQDQHNSTTKSRLAQYGMTIYSGAGFKAKRLWVCAIFNRQSCLDRTFCQKVGFACGNRTVITAHILHHMFKTAGFAMYQVTFICTFALRSSDLSSRSVTLRIFKAFLSQWCYGWSYYRFKDWLKKNKQQMKWTSKGHYSGVSWLSKSVAPGQLRYVGHKEVDWHVGSSVLSEIQGILCRDCGFWNWYICLTFLLSYRSF